MDGRRTVRMAVVAAASVAIGLSVSPTSAAAPGWTPEVPGDSGAVTGAGFGPTLGVGDPSSYTGGSTSNNFCYATCGAATIGVGGPSSYTGGATSSNRGGTATWGVGDVNSYTGGATGGTTDNGTNATDRTDNYGPGHS